jgi:hypothetical protein
MKKMIFITLLILFAFSFCGPKALVCPEGQLLVIDKAGKSECKAQEVKKDDAATVVKEEKKAKKKK